MQVINDLCKVRLETDEYGFGVADKDTAESGILEALPDKFNFFGYWSFAYEKSFMDEDKLSKIYDYYSSFIGKRVFWTALSERGNILEKDGTKYAFIKLTSLIAIDDPNSKAQSVHSDGSGSFGLEK